MHWSFSRPFLFTGSMYPMWPGARTVTNKSKENGLLGEEKGIRRPHILRVHVQPRTAYTEGRNAQETRNADYTWSWRGMSRSWSSPFNQIALEQQNSKPLAANTAEFLNICVCEWSKIRMVRYENPSVWCNAVFFIAWSSACSPRLCSGTRRWKQALSPIRRGHLEQL